MIHIESQLPLPVDVDLLKAAARRTLEYLGEKINVSLTLVFGDDALLKRYNQQYLGVDSPTDVLSFPSDFTDPDSNSRYLGDILISLPQAQQQAALGGFTLTEELQLLVVHGVLHLLGYDHAEPDDIARMQAVQDAVMHQLGSSNTPKL